MILIKKTPDPEVLNRILNRMQAKEKAGTRGVVIPFRMLQWAAACLVLIIGGIALLMMQKQPAATPKVIAKTVSHSNIKNMNTDSLASVQPATLVKSATVKRKNVDSIDNDLILRKQALLSKLKAKNVDSKKQFVFASLNNMESPASRINAASAMNEFKNTGNDVVDALVQTLNTDPSANVRLAALDGLTRFYQNTYVRKKLIGSLKKQQDPVVQIALINMLTRMRESGILTELDKIVNDDNTMKAVKDCAYSSILRLRSS